ncbi:MAG TPA: PstS family phosphate ABC transporter substrate-binding protein [Dehalococcoidia bacterium]|nr:PstS family phosphate ABC transporter substrate-binding protein [Dehalococcoidia bacterium]
MAFIRRLTSANRWQRTALLLGASITLVALALTACGDDSEGNSATKGPGQSGTTAKVTGTVSIEGSSTVQPFTIDLIDAFGKKHPDVKVNPPSGKGSGAGITAFINKEVDIAQSSRKIKDDEVTQAKAAGLDPFETHILDDALAIVVNPDNGVDQLTEEQVAKIFSGQITDWSEVGGKSGNITVYTRNEESGSFAYMEEEVIQKVLGKDAKYSPDINKQANAPAGLTAVAGDSEGVFYAGLGNLAEIPSGKVKVIKVSKDSSSIAVEPTEATVKDRTYPIARGLYYYSNADPMKSTNAAVRAFIEFALSPEGQKLGEDIGFVGVR